MQFVDKEDIENISINNLRIRRGCSIVYDGHNACACWGGCWEVVGSISRTEYNQFGLELWRIQKLLSYLSNEYKRKLSTVF